MGFFDPLGIAEGAKSFFSPDEPYEAAEREARRQWEEAQKYAKPYWQQGLDQYGRLNEAAGKLLNPGQLESEWIKGYETSPWAKQLLGLNTQLGEEEASRMGLLGSSGALSNIQQGAGNIVAQDRQNYLNSLMQKYMQGIGLGENIYGVGAQMGQNLLSGGQRHGENMAGLAYGKAAAPGELFGRLLGAGAGAAANYFAPGSGSFVQGRFNQGIPGYMQNAIYGGGV